MTTNEKLHHLISLLTAKRDGKKLQKHSSMDDSWIECDEMKVMCMSPERFRIAPEPAPKGEVCEWCKTEIDDRTWHISIGSDRCCEVYRTLEGIVDYVNWPKPTPELTPAYRPYKDESERPFFAGYRLKIMDKITYFPIAVGPGGLWLATTSDAGGKHYTWDDLFNDFFQTTNGRDWTPAGVEEK